jgi:Protein of unknown function (DUF642)
MVKRFIASATVLALAGCATAAQLASTMPAAGNRDAYAVQSAPSFQHCPRSPGGSGILKDGDFHDAPDPEGSYLTYYKGQGFATAWRVTRRSVDLQGSRPSGFPCSIDLDGYNVGAIEHAPLRTKPNANYTVTFLFSGNNGGPPEVKTMKVEAAGQSETLQWNDSQGGQGTGKFTIETWSFTAHSPLTTLRFISLDAETKNSDHGPIVGPVSVTEGT